MLKANLPIEVEKIFGILLLLVGSMLILIPPTMSLTCIVQRILGITLVMQGTVFIWSATERLRQKQREKHKNEDTKGQ
jgi:uncharacterized membrane protein HdeD (DUF308 family)